MIDYTNEKKAYSEVYAFINALGDEYKNQIPEKIFNNIKDNRDFDYNPIYHKDQALQTGDITREALALIAALNLQYWCKDEDVKTELKKQYIENGKKEEAKYNDIFKDAEEKVRLKVEESKRNLENQNSKALVIKKDSIFSKVLNFIKNIFKRY